MPEFCLRAAAGILLIAAASVSVMAAEDPAQQLPQSAPVPQLLDDINPDDSIGQESPAAERAPVPDERPAARPETADTPSRAVFPAAPPPGAPFPGPAAAAPSEPMPQKAAVPEPPASPPATAPLPTPSPVDDKSSEATAEPPPESKPAKPLPPPAPTQPPPEELACRARLETLGARFATQPAESDPSGCSLPYPIRLSSFSPDVAIEPPVVVNCLTAETAAAFVREIVSPDIDKTFGSKLTTVEQQSGYVCRPRAGTRKLSEHAFGNAIDFGSFTLADGRRLKVESTSDVALSAFLTRMRLNACGPFKTVLGPGSDEDHATHLHFDMAARRNVGTFCQ